MTESTPTATRYTRAGVVRRLRDSLADVEFALQMIPPQWTHEAPEVRGLPADSWTVAMNLAHLAIYDEEVGGVMLESFAPGFDPTERHHGGGETWFYDDAVALSHEPVEVILGRLRSGRQRQIAIVEAHDDAWLHGGTTPLWPDPLHTPGWVATKTFQHTWEHGNAILRVALFAPR
jgi:hypothetical protein